MRDQAVLVRNAVKNEIPAFALIGKDKFALQTFGILLFPGKRRV